MLSLNKCCKFHGNVDMHEIEIPGEVLLHMICEECGNEWVE